MEGILKWDGVVSFGDKMISKAWETKAFTYRKGYSAKRTYTDEASSTVYSLYFNIEISNLGNPLFNDF